MKKTDLIGILTICLLTIACHHSKDERLERLYTMLDSSPQEALSELDSLEDDYAKADEHTRMRYALIRYKAEDKCYRPLTSDSTIKNICAYFEAHGDYREKMESYFYLGCTYHELRNYPYAINAYGRAVSIAETNQLTWSDSIALSRIYGHMADVNRRINRNQEAYELMHKSFQMQMELGDGDVQTYEDMGRFAEIADSLQEAAEYYHTSLVMMAKENATEKYVIEMGEQLGFYCDIKDKDFAELTYSLIKKVNPDSLPANVFSAIACYFNTFDTNTDSILYYNLKAYERTRLVERKASRAKKLASLYMKMGEKEKALEYAMMGFAYADSAEQVISEEGTEASKKQAHLYNLEEMRLMATENELRNKLNITIMIAWVTSIISLIVISFYLLNRRKMKISLLTKERDEIQEKHQQMGKMVETDRKLRAENATDITTLRVRLNKLANSPKEKLEEDQWGDVYDAIDQQYPLFREKLLSLNKNLSHHDLIFIYLKKLGFSFPNIGKILGIPRSSIYRQFQSLEKLLGRRIEDLL